VKPESSLLDVACGSGVFARHIPNEARYLGLDISKSLIETARKMDGNKKHNYVVCDVTDTIKTDELFENAVIILALQNIKEPEKAIDNISKKLKDGGKLLIVLNHPSFRIPRQSGWEIDKINKQQYRRVNRYMNPVEIPVEMHPGKHDGQFTWSYHHPLSDYSDYLYKSGLLIEKIEEWTSEKTSKGKAANMENRAREEFPMFMAILAVKR
jgi:SAM-dependent methyltransferase